MAARKDAATWAQIEVEYRTGQDSVRAIADRHDVSEAAIRKRAGKEGWTRLDDKRALAIALPPPRTPPAPETADPADLADRGRRIVGRLWGELDAVTTHVGELVELIEEETAEDRSPKRREAMFRAISLGSRAMTAKALAGALGALSEAVPAKGKKELAADAAKAVSVRFKTMAPPTQRPN